MNTPTQTIWEYPLGCIPHIANADQLTQSAFGIFFSNVETFRVSSPALKLIITDTKEMYYNCVGKQDCEIFDGL